MSFLPVAAITRRTSLPPLKAIRVERRGTRSSRTMASLPNLSQSARIKVTAR